MWIERRTYVSVGNTSAKWTILEQNEFFIMEWQQDNSARPAAVPESSPATRSGVVLAKPYRILIRIEAFPVVFPREEEDNETRIPVVVIAIADDEVVIREHWNFLTRNIMPQATQFDLATEQRDLYNFISKKISAMATEEDLAGVGKRRGSFLGKAGESIRPAAISPSGSLSNSATNIGGTGPTTGNAGVIGSVDDRDAAAKNRLRGLKKLIQSHAGDWNREKGLVLVDYECSLSLEIKRAGCMWITPNSVYFLDEEERTHVLLRMHEIMHITMKSITNSGTPDSVELSTAKCQYFFTDFKNPGQLGVEGVQRVLASLWSAALYRIHSLSVSTLLDKEGGDDDGEGEEGEGEGEDADGEDDEDDDSNTTSDSDMDTSDDDFDEDDMVPSPARRSSVSKGRDTDVFVMEGVGGSESGTVDATKPVKKDEPTDGSKTSNPSQSFDTAIQARIADSGLRSSRESRSVGGSPVRELVSSLKTGGSITDESPAKEFVGAASYAPEFAGSGPVAVRRRTVLRNSRDKDADAAPISQSVPNPLHDDVLSMSIERRDSFTTSNSER